MIDMKGELWIDTARAFVFSANIMIKIGKINMSDCQGMAVNITSIKMQEILKGEIEDKSSG